MASKNFDLEERLIAFAIMILDLCERIPNSYAGNHLGNQLLRSGTSPALNYGEVQASESRKDFIHKMKVCLKELRESYVCLKILRRQFENNQIEFQPALKECNELVAIFATSIKTAQSRIKK